MSRLPLPVVLDGGAGSAAARVRRLTADDSEHARRARVLGVNGEAECSG
jgi:hypothetical protein